MKNQATTPAVKTTAIIQVGSLNGSDMFFCKSAGIACTDDIWDATVFDSPAAAQAHIDKMKGGAAPKWQAKMWAAATVVSVATDK